MIAIYTESGESREYKATKGDRFILMRQATTIYAAEFLPDYANLEEMKAHYRRGGLGDGTCKKFLFNVLEETLAPIRAERARWAKDIDTVYDILAAGTAKAVETTNETLAQVRKAMRIDYFTDRSIVKEWETLLRKANQ